MGSFFNITGIFMALVAISIPILLLILAMIPVLPQVAKCQLEIKTI